MLASITPLGERGRQSLWGVTIVFFIVGATACGAAAGALLGFAGQLLIGTQGGSHVRLTALAVALVAAVVIELAPLPRPGPRRQVDVRWLDRYRGWVYGLGYGAQLGLGVTTIVSSMGLYAALAAAFLTGRPAAGALVMGTFGAIRGLTPLAAAGVRDPAALLRLHSRLDAARRRVQGGTLAGLGVLMVVSILAGAA